MKFLQRANKEVCHKNSVPEDDCGASILQNRHENFVKPTDCWIRVLACGHLRHHKSCLQTFSLGWKKTETKRIQKRDGRDNGFFFAKDCRDVAVVPRGTEDTIWKLLWRFTHNTQGAYKKIIICQIGRKMQRDVCRGAESGGSNFQCSRERLLVHEQNWTLWQQCAANDLLLSDKEKNGYKDVELRSSRTRALARAAARPLARAPFAQQHHLRTHTLHWQRKGKRWRRREEIRELEGSLGKKEEKARKMAGRTRVRTMYPISGWLQVRREAREMGF